MPTVAPYIYLPFQPVTSSKPFIKTVLKGIIKQAQERGVTEVDREFVEMINKERNG